mgnify:FL=1
MSAKAMLTRPLKVSCLYPTEILDRVKKGGELPFRPRIGDLAERYDTYVTDLLKDCWSENPEERPSFKVIQLRLKPLQKGM